MRLDDIIFVEFENNFSSYNKVYEFFTSISERIYNKKPVIRLIMGLFRKC